MDAIQANYTVTLTAVNKIKVSFRITHTDTPPMPKNN